MAGTRVTAQWPGRMIRWSGCGDEWRRCRMADLTRIDVIRRFYALFLGVTVESDGRVKGFGKWYDDCTPYARKRAESMAEAAWRKIASGHLDPEEVIILAVQGLRLTIEHGPPPETRSR